MQIRSFRGSGEPARVIALSNARDGLGPDPRRALGPAAIRAASTGRTRDRTRPMLEKRQKTLAKAPSTRDPVSSVALIQQMGGDRSESGHAWRALEMALLNCPWRTCRAMVITVNGTMIHVDAYLQYAFGSADEAVE